MEAFRQHEGIVVPLDRANVDTDAIIPKQFLRKIDRKGFGRHLFHEWRYQDYAGTKENPDFVLNQDPYRKGTILLARDNFGCGSSREHAPWALADYGFRAILAPSFADIFFNNCVQNGILCVILPSETVDAMFQQVTAKPGLTFQVDLEQQIVTDAEGKKHPFEIHPFARHCLLEGLDPIAWTLQYEDAIQSFEEKDQKLRPWGV